MSSGGTLWWKRCSGVIAVNSPWGKWKHIAWHKINDVTQFRGWGRSAHPNFTIWMAHRAASQTHHGLWLPSKHSLAWVWQRRCYQLRRLTHFTLSPRAFHSQKACERGSQRGVAGRHLHHMRFSAARSSLSAPQKDGLPPVSHANMYRANMFTHTCMCAQRNDGASLVNYAIIAYVCASRSHSQGVKYCLSVTVDVLFFGAGAMICNCSTHLVWLWC